MYNLNKWSHKIPLFIRGKNGCGKTTLAFSLLKDYNIIDAIELSDNTVTKDTINLLHSQIKKKDILQIFTNQNKGKAIIFDDIQFYVKSVYKYIYDFIKKIKYIPIIFICNEITSREISRLEKLCYYYEHNPSYQDIIEILKLNNISLDYNNAIKLIKETSKNITTMVTLGKDFMHLKDEIYGCKDIMYELHNNKKLDICDIFSKVTEYNTVSYNLLTDIENYIPYFKCILKIYESIIQCEYFEFNLFKNNEKFNIDLYILLGVVYPYKYFVKYRNNNEYIYKYNNYVSNTMISISQVKNLNNFYNSFNVNIDLFIMYIYSLSTKDLKILSKSEFMKSFKEFNFNIKNRLIVTSNIYDKKIDVKIFNQKLKFLNI
jgi:hypothetical protein